MRCWLAAASLVAIFIPLPASALSPSPPESEAVGFERTPPRLAFVDGDVSFQRPGADGWAPARVNMPLAPSDELALGDRANVEVQILPRAWLRAGGESSLGFTSLEPDFLQFRLSRGTAALDVRSLPAGYTLEIDTPSAAFTVERAGYYRVEVDEDETSFISRRGGNAGVTFAGRSADEVAANTQLVVTGTRSPARAIEPAPDLDDWDRWNYARSTAGLDSETAQYVPDDEYGVAELDAYGSWRVVATYGPVWFPRVAIGWAPYSVGTWAFDPYFGWTWVDDAPWGWAPFHYGRWVRIRGRWAWSPGPRGPRVYYAPALVAFYGSWGSTGVSVSIGFGSSYIGWVPLGWGEPLVPWWGPRGCRGTVRWAGWAGPRIVNGVRVRKKTVVTVNSIHRYAHGGSDGVVAVELSHFGRGHVHGGALAHRDAAKLKPVRGGRLGIEPAKEAFAGGARDAHDPRRGHLPDEVVTSGRHTGRERAARTTTPRFGRRPVAPPADRDRNAAARERGRSTGGRGRGARHRRRRFAAPTPPASFRAHEASSDRSEGGEAAPEQDRNAGRGAAGNEGPGRAGNDPGRRRAGNDQGPQQQNESAHVPRPSPAAGGGPARDRGRSEAARGHGPR